MPEKITILKDSGESINSNIVSVFTIPETNREYIITTENAVDPHGLTVLHVSEVKDDTLVKVETDEEWSSIKTIMRAIISSSVGSYQYILSFDNAKASGQYSRDISVSSAAAKQMVESYASGEKVSLVVEDVSSDPETPQGDSIFPTAPVATSDDEVVPGIAEVTADETTEIEQTVTQPVVGEGSDVPMPPVTPTSEEVSTEDSGAPIEDGDASSLEAAEEPVVPIVDPVENSEVTSTEPVIETPVDVVSTPIEMPPMDNNVQNDSVQFPEGNEQENDINLVISTDVMAQNVNEVPNPVMPGQEIIPGDMNVSNDMAIPASTDEVTSSISFEAPEAVIPLVGEQQVENDVQNVAEISENVIDPSIEGVANVEMPTSPFVSVAPVAVPSPEVPGVEIPQVGMEQPQINMDGVQNINPVAMDQQNINSVDPMMMQQNVNQINPMIAQQMMQQQYYQQMPVQQPQIPPTGVLKNLGIEIDFGADPNLSSKANLDEVVAGAQELFIEGVKNLIMVMSERMYRDLKSKEEDLKRREIIVAQREQAINERTMAMMNGDIYSQQVSMQGQPMMVSQQSMPQQTLQVPPIGMPQQAMIQQPQQMMMQQPQQAMMQQPQQMIMSQQPMSQQQMQQGMVVSPGVVQTPVQNDGVVQ